MSTDSKNPPDSGVSTGPFLQSQPLCEDDFRLTDNPKDSGASMSLTAQMQPPCGDVVRLTKTNFNPTLPSQSPSGLSTDLEGLGIVNKPKKKKPGKLKRNRMRAIKERSEEQTGGATPTQGGVRRSLTSPEENPKLTKAQKIDETAGPSFEQQRSYARTAAAKFTGTIAPASSYTNNLEQEDYDFLSEKIEEEMFEGESSTSKGLPPFFEYFSFSSKDFHIHVGTKDQPSLEWCKEKVESWGHPTLGTKYKVWTQSDWEKIKKLRISVYNHRHSWDNPETFIKRIRHVNPEYKGKLLDIKPLNSYVTKENEEGTEQAVARNYIFLLDEDSFKMLINNDMQLRYGLEPLILGSSKTKTTETDDGGMDSSRL